MSSESNFFWNRKEFQEQRERRNVEKKALRIGAKQTLFSYGTKELGLGTVDSKLALQKFIRQWFEHPENVLGATRRMTEFQHTSVQKLQASSEFCYTFPSAIDTHDTAKFYESSAPFYARGEKIAFIIIPHWNAFFDKYRQGTTLIRTFFLPVATFRYFPTYHTEKAFTGTSRYDIIGPNIGLMIKRCWQDVLNIQFFAQQLKETFGYEKVGIWSYSIGSPRGLLASLFSNGLIDSLIMHSLADSFSEAILHGIATQAIARTLRKHETEQELEDLLSPLSPGKYEPYFSQLPQNTRLIQGKYDLVFGENNNRRIVKKIRKRVPFVEVEYGNFGHTTQGEFDKAIPIIYRNSQFVFRHSKLRLGFSQS